MFMPRRSKDKIIADILEICLMPKITKTKIVYPTFRTLDSRR
ncbi:MAG: winged helix-turn-helix domain-containing protein [Methanothrix sp.]